MPKGNVVRICDYDRREPDAVGVRDPADSAVIIILPVVRIEKIEPPDIQEARCPRVIRRSSRSSRQRSVI